jgi:hypothetical protein
MPARVASFSVSPGGAFSAVFFPDGTYPLAGVPASNGGPSQFESAPSPSARADSGLSVSDADLVLEGKPLEMDQEPAPILEAEPI